MRYNNISQAYVGYGVDIEETGKTGFDLSVSNITLVMSALLIVSSMSYFSLVILQSDQELLFVGRFSGVYAIATWIAYEVLSRKGDKWYPVCGVLSSISALLAAGSVLAIQISTGSIQYFLSAGQVAEEPDWFWYGPYLGWSLALVMSLLALYRIRFLPLWTITLVSTLILGLDLYMKTFEDEFFLNVLKEFTITVGLAMLSAGLVYDYFSRYNHGFWFNKIGLFVFSYGMGAYFKEGTYSDRYTFLAISILAAMIAVFQRRQGGAGFGFLGILTFLAWQYDISGAPIVLMMSIVILATLAITATVALEGRKMSYFRFPDFVDRIRPPARKDPITFGMIGQ